MSGTVLVCGGRTYADEPRLFRALDVLHERHAVIRLVHGAAPGADTLAARWAALRRIPHVTAYPADWKRHGRAAGPLRNARMLVEAKPNWVVAFPGGVGTADMVAKARVAGVPVWEVTP